MLKTVKFGGSSLADAEHFKKASAIVKADPCRRYAVASAPGKRHSDDEKVTDMLIALSQTEKTGEDPNALLHAISERFAAIIKGLELDMTLDADLGEIGKRVAEKTATRDYLASRGEYLNAKVMAAYLGYDFIDAAECIFFDDKGFFDAEKTNVTLAKKLTAHERAVLPGFYGSLPNGEIKTFSRGGSDVTGSILARASRSDVYENWTDVSGMLMADPRCVKDPCKIETITYRELRELSYMGASVLHEDAIFPVRIAGIPINIRNTNAPEDEGTWIKAFTNEKPLHVITGIAGKKGLTAIYIEKEMMNNQIGFGKVVLEILAEHGIGFEHLPSGIDTMSVIVNTADFEGEKREVVLKALRDRLRPDTIKVHDEIALVAVVGRGMVNAAGTAVRVFSALAKQHINVRMIDQGSSELNIIVGVDADNLYPAIRAIYSEFVRG